MRTLITGLFMMSLSLPAAAAASTIAVLGDVVYTMAGDPIEKGVVLIEDGKIARVGKQGRVRIPDGVTVREAAVVTPGFVDAHSTVGLSGVYGGRAGQVRDQDQLDDSDPVQPALDPVDAYNTRDPLIEWIRRYGVTTIHTGHGPGAVISGRTMIVKTTGDVVEDALVETDTAIAVTLGDGIDSDFDSPGTDAKTVAMFRAALLDAQEYARKLESEEPPGRDLGKEVLVRVLSGDIAVMVTAHSVTEIAAALRLKREFDLKLWLDGVADAQLMLDEIKAADVPVLLHAPRLRARRETKNAAFDTGRVLAEAEIPFAYQTGYEGYVPKSRVMLFETQVAVSSGLSFADGLVAMTTAPAAILGIDDRVGSLERGKDGDVVLFDGDPFEYTSHVCGVVIEGEIVSDACH